MSRLRIVLSIVVLLCLVGWSAYAQGQRPARQLWEYRIVETQFLESYTAAEQVQQILNQGGADGWELVRIDEKRYYFKRPK